MPKDVDAILKAAREIMRRDPNKSWFSKMPSNAKSRLSEIKKGYEEGRFEGISLAAICKAIESLLKEQKWPAPKSKHTISRWLRSSDT